MRRFPILLLVLLPAIAAAQAAPQTERRPLRVTDIYRLRDVRDPQVSPDGAWIAYTLSSIDSAKDKSDTDVWMVSWDGATNLRLTSTPENESSPRWSPDGRYLAFVSGRQEGKGGQVWLLDRRGGEAQRITQIRDGVSDYAWSPDSKRLLVGINEETDSLLKKDTSERKTPRPIVIDRYQFKRDVSGYLQTKRSRLSIFDVETRKLEPLTTGMANDGSGAWSPDGKWVAFIRTPVREPEALENSDLWVIEARPGAEARRLVDLPASVEGRPAWSPDGQWLAFLLGDEPKYSAYDMNKLAIVRADGSARARVLTEAFDRGLSSPTFAPDGRSIYALTADDRAQHFVRVRVSDGSVERVIAGKRVVSTYDVGGMGRIAALAATPDRTAEVFAWDNGALRALTHHNDSLFARLQLGTTEDFSSRSADGTEVHGLLVRPAGAQSALPTILYIHGGPNSQDSYQFSFDREFFAANGYAVLAINYRGSAGRGAAYSKAIFADWGNKEVVDLLGAVDEAVRRGIADPNRLGIGGWSYGGILTDYTIATTTRFAAAVSGAGSAMQLSMYGTDQYIPQYDLEIGYPWKNQDRWIRISYPFFHADRIRTPTLFMGGQNDFNVPIIGGEQMYQALRTLGVPTQLVVYPNQYHGITVPSYRVDRLQRYVAWYDRYLKQGVIQASGAQPSR